MLIPNFVLFLVALFILVKSADYAVRYSSKLSRVFHISEFVVSFFIISVVSVLPEATVSIIAAINGVPEFGIGTLLGSNVADLSLVFGIVAIFSLKGIRVKSEILKNDMLYLILILVPILLGLDGRFSRIDGIILVLSGVVFYITLSIESKMFKKKLEEPKNHKWVKNLVILILSLAVLIISAQYTVRFGIGFANDIGMPPFLVALTMVAIGTCLPELIFSLRAIKTRHDELAMGDILGTVITDATIVMGILALINPFSFDPKIIYVTGSMMFIASALVIIFIKSGKVLSKKEGVYLLLFFILSLIIEFVVNHAF
jgi:cation:H+ antiporter